MAKFVAHEVEVPPVDGSSRDQANHLVQRDAAINLIGALHPLRHKPVHVGVDQPENNGFIPYQCLVVALGVRDCLLIVSPVGRLPPDGGGGPIFIFLLLDNLDPVVGDIHGHAVVEPIPARLDIERQPGHPAHLFRDGNGVGIHLVNQLVRQREIADCIAILPRVVVIAILGKRFSQPMAQVNHRGHPIESKTVELELL